MTAIPMTIATSDGLNLRGQLWPSGADWVVLLHDAGEEEDLDGWRPLVPYRLGADLSVLAVDLRGHGASDGEWTDAAAVADVASILRFARGHDAGCVVVVGAGASAAHALWAVEVEQAEGSVALSARVPTPRVETRGAPSSPGRALWVEPGVSTPGSAMPATPPAGLPRAAGVPKLFVVGSQDPAARETTDRLRAASIGWSLITSLPTADRGTALLDGPWAGHVREQLLAFVREQQVLAHAAREGRRESGDLGETVDVEAKGDGG
jgi:pimeloyl-ACP methyl ester carboxylesterase